MGVAVQEKGEEEEEVNEEESHGKAGARLQKAEKVQYKKGSFDL